MEGDQQTVGLKSQSKFFFELLSFEQFEPVDMIYSWRTDVEYVRRVFTQLNNSVLILLCGREMQVGHFGNAVTDSIIKSPAGDFSSMDMRDRDHSKQRRTRSGKQFKTIAQQQHNIRL